MLIPVRPVTVQWLKSWQLSTIHTTASQMCLSYLCLISSDFSWTGYAGETRQPYDILLLAPPYQMLHDPQEGSSISIFLSTKKKKKCCLVLAMMWCSSQVTALPLNTQIIQFVLSARFLAFVLVYKKYIFELTSVDNNEQFLSSLVFLLLVIFIVATRTSKIFPSTNLAMSITHTLSLITLNAHRVPHHPSHTIPHHPSSRPPEQSTPCTSTQQQANAI